MTHPPAQSLLFMRHGATALNLAGLRCGGDVDVALDEHGRCQAVRAARQVAALVPPVGLIVTSPLLRTRETADIVGRLLPGVETLIEPAFTERRLGAWNGRPIADTEAALAARLTPPGGESCDAFAERVAAGLAALLPRLPQRPLVVASKGVARVLSELLGRAACREAGNGELIEFDLRARIERNLECPS